MGLEIKGGRHLESWGKQVWWRQTPPRGQREWQSHLILGQTIQSKEMGTGRATDRTKEGEGRQLR